ncbi:MAG: AI-2E family transporter [Spirulina sp. SIO3F2]|nr:AI-2E family transporter [Spirulina sp. SIO3F2]
MSERSVTLSLSTLVNVALAIVVTLLCWQLRWLVVVLMVAVVIAATLAPAVDRAQKWRVPRWLAVILLYLLLISGIVGLALLIGPAVFEQLERLIRKLPVYLDKIEVIAQDWVVRLGLTDPMVLAEINKVLDIQSLTTWGFRTSQELLVRSYSLTRGVLGGSLSVLLALLLSGYLLAGSERIIEGIVSLFPTPWDQRLQEQVGLVGQRMGNYIQGRILVSAILSVLISVGLQFLGIAEFSLALGAIAGVTNLIPFFGPILGAIPALIVAIAQGGWLFVWVLLLFLLIQNLETYVLDPLLVGNTVKVLPIYQLLAVLGGTQVLGIVGAIIVPPWVAGGAVLLDNLYLKPKRLAAAKSSS